MFVLTMPIYSGDIQFDLAGFFYPYIQQWLVNTDNKTTQWVQAVSIYLSCGGQRTHSCLRQSPPTMCVFDMFLLLSVTDLALSVPTRG